MGDCPLAHTFHRVSGGGWAQDVFAFDSSTNTLTISGWDPSQLGLHEFYVRAHINDGIHSYRFEDFSFSIYKVEVPTDIHPCSTNQFETQPILPMTFIFGSNTATIQTF